MYVVKCTLNTDVTEITEGGQVLSLYLQYVSSLVDGGDISKHQQECGGVSVLFLLFFPMKFRAYISLSLFLCNPSTELSFLPYILAMFSVLCSL